MTESNLKKNLRFHWTASGLASALGGFVPIPFFEEVIDARAKRYAITQTLKSHSIALEEGIVNVITGSTPKRLSRLLHYAVAIPLKLLLFPFRKFVLLLWSSKDLPSDFAHTYLLAKTMDWCMKEGLLTDKTSASEAAKLRTSFDEAFSRIDESSLKFIREILQNELSSIKPSMIKLVVKISGRKVDGRDESHFERKAQDIQKQMSAKVNKKGLRLESASRSEELFRKFLVTFKSALEKSSVAD